MDTVQFFDPETEETIDFYVLEETAIGGVKYLLVTEDEEGDADAFIMKDLSDEDDQNSIYEMVEDDKELEAIAKVFAELMEDVDVDLEF